MFGKEADHSIVRFDISERPPVERLLPQRDETDIAADGNAQAVGSKVAPCFVHISTFPSLALVGRKDVGRSRIEGAELRNMQ